MKEETISFKEQVILPDVYSIYRYPAKFIPHAVAYILKTYAEPGDIVFDPFAGYGTVGVLAFQYGMDYELWDLNPLLETIHSTYMVENLLDPDDCIKIFRNRFGSEEFHPDWDNIHYWYEPEIYEFISKLWGIYHHFLSEDIKKFVAIPLLKVSRYFSYDDFQRQKLSKSPRSIKRVKDLLSQEWRQIFWFVFRKEIKRLYNILSEFLNLKPKGSKGIIKSGIDTLEHELDRNVDILITSPPYLQSQEYIRYSKIDLFWLGYTQKFIANLSKKEIPYRNTIEYNIESSTFWKLYENIKEKHLRKIFYNYFSSVLKTFSFLQKKVNKFLCIFVGRSSFRGNSIPIDKILIEHLQHIGWEYQHSYIDYIKQRRMFNYTKNPATGIKDVRTPFEIMIILKRK